MRALLIILSVLSITSPLAAQAKTITGAPAEAIFKALSSIDGHIGRSSHFVGVPRVNDYIMASNYIAEFAGFYCISETFIDDVDDGSPICLFTEMDLEQFRRTKAILEAVGLITAEQRRTLRRASIIKGRQAMDNYEFIRAHLDVEVAPGLHRGEHMWAQVIDILGMRCVEHREDVIGEADLRPYEYECRFKADAQIAKINALLEALNVEAVEDCREQLSKLR